MNLPYKNMPIPEAVQYCAERGITEVHTNVRKTGRLDKLSRFTGISLDKLIAGLAQDAFAFGDDLVPNTKLAPLSKKMKIVIRDNYSDHTQAKALAQYMNTSYQNIRLAQRGDFKEAPTKRATQSPGTRVLTFEEKVDIYYNYRDVPTAEVAAKFNTRYQYAQRAQFGDFKRRSSRHTVNITEEQAGYLGLPQHVTKVYYVD